MIKSIILGANGMDGSNLCEYLLSLGHEVHGTIRRHSYAESQDIRIAHLSDLVKTYYFDLADQGSIERIFSDIMPDQIYHLAAQSHVRVSSDIPQFTFLTNAVGTINVLEAYRRICPEARLYFAGSSEMYGNTVDEDGYQRETTPMHPVSPYGVSKLSAYRMVCHYRNAYKLHCVTGILFNHSGPRRSSAFIEQKVCKQAVEIKLGLRSHIELGNLDSHRDWGHSKDYVRAMHLIVSQDTPDDYVVSMQETRSVLDMVRYVFAYLGLDPEPYIVINPKYYRPEDLTYLKGDSSRIRQLGWKPAYTFESMLKEMIDHWLCHYRNMPGSYQTDSLPK